MVDSVDSSKAPHHKNLSRKSSFSNLEDYQRKIVERIKKQLDKRKSQWEDNLAQRAKPDKVVAEKKATDGIELSAPPAAESDDEHKIKLVSTSLRHLEHGQKEHTFRVDINAYVQSGTVTVRLGQGCVIVMARLPVITPGVGRQKSNVRRILPVDGVEMNSPLNVKTTKEGFLEIRVTTTSSTKRR